MAAGPALGQFGDVLSTMARLLGALVIVTLSLIAIGLFAWVDNRSGVSAYEQGNLEMDPRAVAERAEQGDVQAQFYLGLMYAKGEGVEQNNVLALKWFDCVAEGASDVDLAHQAKAWRDAIAKSLAPAFRHKARAMASSACGIPMGAEARDRPGLPTFKPSRDGLLEMIALTPGDLVIAGLLGLAHAFGLFQLQAAVFSLFVDYGNTFVAIVAALCWVLLGLVFIQSMGWFEDFGIDLAHLVYGRANPAVKDEKEEQDEGEGEEEQSEGPFVSEGKR